MKTGWKRMISRPPSITTRPLDACKIFEAFSCVTITTHANPRKTVSGGVGFPPTIFDMRRLYYITSRDPQLSFSSPKCHRGYPISTLLLWRWFAADLAFIKTKPLRSRLWVSGIAWRQQEWVPLMWAAHRGDVLPVHTCVTPHPCSMPEVSQLWPHPDLSDPRSS